MSTALARGRRSHCSPAARRAASAALAFGLAPVLPAQAADTIKVGVLHSLSGTMAISETTLKDAVLMLIEEQNKKGGVLGKMLEAVVVDPASNWPLFAEKASELSPRTRSPRCSAAGPRYRASRCCRCSRRSTASCSIRCSTKARSERTSSTPAPRRTSRRSRGGLPDVEDGGERSARCSLAPTTFIRARRTRFSKHT